MFTEIKLRKDWQNTETESPLKPSTVPFEEELLGYNFLRNIWGTYYYDRHNVTSQDKVDHINKIVGMMKTQANQTQKLCLKPDQANAIQTSQHFQEELDKTKESLERSRMFQQELLNLLNHKNQQIEKVVEQNNALKMQISDLKHAKNKCEQKIILSSNRIYQMERKQSGFETARNDKQQNHSINNTLDKFYAYSTQKEQIQIHSVMDRKQQLFHDQPSLDQSVCSFNQEINQPPLEELSEMNLNLPIENRNTMRMSLQFNNLSNKTLSNSSSVNFIRQMEKMKIKTERIMQIQNERISISKGSFRKTLEPSSSRPILKALECNLPQRQKRFRRIR